MAMLADNVIGIWGDKGRKWVVQLPYLVELLVQKWKLKVPEPFSNLAFNYLLNAKSNLFDFPVVVKIVFDLQEFERELQYLDIHSGRGVVRILDYDRQLRALLLERIQPGISIKSLFAQQDEQACLIAVEVIKNLHRTQSPSRTIFSTVDTWLIALHEQHNHIPKHHLNQARKLSADLIISQAPTVLLHGDLHHENILLHHHDTWKAIDPKGVLGEPMYEIGALIRNPIDLLHNHEQAKEIIQRRLDLYSHELNYDKQRLQEWAYVQTILAACWADDNLVLAQQFIRVAELIALCR